MEYLVFNLLGFFKKSKHKSASKSDFLLKCFSVLHNNVAFTIRNAYSQSFIGKIL